MQDSPKFTSLDALLDNDKDGIISSFSMQIVCGVPCNIGRINSLVMHLMQMRKLLALTAPLCQVENHQQRMRHCQCPCRVSGSLDHLVLEAMAKPSDIVGWYDLSWSGGSFPICFRPAGVFFCPKFQQPSRWELEGDILKFDAETKSMDGNAVPKSDDEKNWRKAAFSRELSPLEALLLGDGAGSEWDFEWSGGKFPVKFKAVN
eukprot:g11516.t1